MARRLPPLNAVRAFEAAARHLSFTRAADELNVTQAAISHQVKALEERLGITLFKRLNRALRLTDAGQAYLPAVRDALDAIAVATDRLQSANRSGRLTVTTLHSFASAWLLPRLLRFREQHPDIDIRLDADDSLSDFARDEIDLAIRHGSGSYPGLTSELLLTEEIFPVCSPTLMTDSHPLRTPEDLRHHTLLHDDGLIDWRTWLAAAGVRGIDADAGPGYTNSRILLDAAVAGQGVALARSVIVADDIVTGRLVRPFELALPAKFAYYIVAPPMNWDAPKIVAFREWLHQEAALRDAPMPRTGLDRLSGPIRSS